MNSIQDFITSAAGQIGAPEADVQSATSSLLGVIKDQADSGDVSALMDKIPGAAGLLGGGSSGGGGGLMGAVGGMLGGGGGVALAALMGSGLGGDKLGSLAALFFSFAKDKAGDSLVQKILGQVPALAKLLG